MSCTCGGKGFGLNGFHYPGAPGCQRPDLADSGPLGSSGPHMPPKLRCVVCGRPSPEGTEEAPLSGRQTLVREATFSGAWSYLRDPSIPDGHNALDTRRVAYVFPSAAAGAWIDARPADERWSTEPE